MIRDFRIFLALWFALFSIASPALATPQQDLVLFGQAHLGQSVIDLNFAKGPPYYLKGATGPLTEGRSTPATAFDANNNLVTCAAFVPCVAGGQLWSYEARTNGEPNSVGSGATMGVVGSGAVVPTGWTILGAPGTAGSYTVTLVGQGVENGVNYIDVNIAGITGTTVGSLTIQPHANNSVSATYGQTWTASYSARYTTPSTGVLQAYFIKQWNTAAGGSIGNATPPITLPPSTSTLASGQFSSSFTPGAPTTGAVAQQLYIQFAISSTPNVTVRFGYSQLELNPALPASVASAVVTAGGSGGTNGTNVNLTVTGGTCTTQPVIQGTIAGNALTAITGYGSPGACSVLPPSPATVTGNSLTGATVTLTPTDNSAKAFATPPILTTNAAVTRNASNLSIATQPCANPSTLASGTPSAPTGFPADQIIAQADDGTQNNRIVTLRAASTGNGFLDLLIGGVGTFVNSGALWAQNTLAKISEATALNSVKLVFNNGAPSSGSPSGSITTSALRIGATIGGTQQINGGISRVALACGSSLTGY